MAIEWSRKGRDIVYYDGVMRGKGQIIKGVFNATTAGYGLKLTSDRTWIERGNADDGGIALATGQAYLFASRRVLLTYAHSGDLSAYGGCDRCSVAADESAVTGFLGGHWGYLEVKNGGKVNVGGAVVGQIDLPTGADVSNVVSCFLANVNHLVSHTGKAVVVHVANPSNSGLLDAFAAFGVDGNDGTGCIASGDGSGAYKYIYVYIAGTRYRIPARAD